MPKNRLYVIVRTDLPCSLPAVQAGHVVAEFCLKDCNADKWDNQTLIYLKVNNLLELQGLCWKLKKRNIQWTEFKEPDIPKIDQQLTAIAVWMDEEIKIFDDLRLLN